METPTRIGRYTISGLLGKGAMGVVYRGRDEGLEREVAVKVLLGQATQAGSKERFRREARAVARLAHTNIVTIYELGEHAGAPFMAMELLDGMDLQRAIEAGLRPDPKITLPIVLQVLAGLAHAHESGIVHRDMKPSNVFLPGRQPAKIMDFGLAHLSGGGSTSKEVAGTPNYMSPEQVSGDYLDGRSDLFSTGLILYELVTGEKAYAGDSVVALLYKIAHETPDLSLIPTGSEWRSLRKVLVRALARDPEARYPDARSMSTELTQGLRDLGGGADWAAAAGSTMIMGRATAATPANQVGATRDPLAAETATPSPERTGAREGRRWLLPAAGATAAAAAALAVGLLWPRSGPITDQPEPIVASPSPPVAEPGSKSPTPTAIPSPRGQTPTPAPAVSPPPTATPAAAPSVDRANTLLEGRRFRAALAQARAVLQDDPGNEEARIIAEDAEAALLVESCISKAEAALGRGDGDAAMEEIQACRAVAPNDARLLALWRRATQ
jgi:serine/threonine-protein kinase